MADLGDVQEPNPVEGITDRIDLIDRGDREVIRRPLRASNGEIGSVGKLAPRRAILPHH